MDTTFRTKSEPSEPVTKIEASKDDSLHSTSEIEAPYTDYKTVNNHPYAVDYFKLGDNWEVFSDEVKTIESFMKDKIASGDIANTRQAVEREIKAMEKLHNVKDDERSVVKVGVLAQYIKFLTNTRNIKRYAN